MLPGYLAATFYFIGRIDPFVIFPEKRNGCLVDRKERTEMEGIAGSISTVQSHGRSSHENNFTIIRFIAAVFVFAGHMGDVLLIQPPLFGGIALHELGARMLFMLGGYLITMSWLSDPNPLRYAIRRFFRLWPPFAVCVLLTTFVAGPLLSEYGVQGYFQNNYKMYLLNLRFFIVFYQPGVFLHTPIPNTTNGSFWTMPVEAALYVVTPLLLSALRVKRKHKSFFIPMAVLTGVAVVFDIVLRVFFHNSRVVLYGTELISAYHLVVFYIIGIFFTCEEVKKHLNMQIGCIAVSALFLFQLAAPALQYLLLYMVFPYLIFSLVFAPNPVFSRFGKKIELSYGIYLYGFFFQQLTVSILQKLVWDVSYTGVLAMSAVPTVIAAVLSYYLVEKPMLKVGRLLIKKLKNNKVQS